MTATGVTGRGPALPGRLARSLRGAGLSGARQQGRQAAEAGARHLVLTHLMPGTDPSAARAAARHVTTARSASPPPAWFSASANPCRVDQDPAGNALAAPLRLRTLRLVPAGSQW
jgi:hypothetical protein